MKTPLLPGARLAAIAAALLPLAVPAAQEVLLAESGAALIPVVVAPGSSESTRAAAAELAKFLGRIAGAPFTVKDAPAGRGIFVGTAAEFPLAAFADDLAIRDRHDGVEAFVIATRPDGLYLVGAAETAVPHAVYRLLDRLGCRWFAPAPEWEIVPKHDRLAVAFEESSRPAILSRRITPGFGYFDRRDGRPQRDFETWLGRNLMGHSLRISAGHAWQSIIIENEEIFDAHPEYLALVKGERRGPQLCVSNPALRELAAAWALERLARRPELDSVSMECSDGLNHCECEDCVAMGSVSDRVFGLANEVARAVSAAHPGKSVGVLAYSDHSEPPSFNLEPNVAVQLTGGFTYGRYTFDELLDRWPGKTSHLGIYEYYSVWPWDFDQLPGGRANDIGSLADRLRDFAQRGIKSVHCEAGNNWGPHGRGYWIASRLMWDPAADVDALLADYYEKAYGPAAAPMRRFHERFDRGAEPLMSEHLLALGFRDVAEAAAKAEARPAVLARIDHIKQYFHYVRLRWEIDHLPKDDPRRKDLTFEVFKWGHRTRYNYMNHWMAIYWSWTKQAAEQFEEPSWYWRGRDEPCPWEDDTPVTRAETERVFRKDLARFRPQPVEEVAFSEDLVPSGIRDAAPRGLWQQFQRPKRYALYSREGGDLAFTIRTGVIAHYRNRADARWTVTGAGGEAIASGRLPQDGEKHTLAVPVPGPGLYWLDYSDNGAAFAIEIAARAPAALALPGSRRILHLGAFRDPVYFFVPPGTKKLWLYWEGGRLAPQLFGPAGDQIAEIDANGRWVAVEVPPGADGAAWHFKRFAPKRLRFANAPNYLAASPGALLVPREALRPSK